MGLLGRDDRQDERLEALEAHVRKLTETLQQAQLDAAAHRIDLMRVQASINEKISSDELDPTFIELNQELGEARKKYEQVSAAAVDSWGTIHEGAAEAMSLLRASVESAADRVGKVVD